MATVYFSIGSNLGDRHALLQAAVSLIAERVGELEACSAFHETEPWGFQSSHPFLNAALRVKTSLLPFDVLALTQQIECELGRVSKSVANVYSDRPIDIDLLMWFDDGTSLPLGLVLDDYAIVNGRKQRLTLPHPLMLQREFVMLPLSELIANN